MRPIAKSIVIAALLIFSTANASPVHVASEAGDIEQVRELIDSGADFDEVDFVAGSPLHIAAVRGYTDVVDLLIKHGADVDSEEFGKSDTPLHWAALGGHSLIIEKLISAGASTDATNDYGNAPLHIATDSGHADAAQALIELGADPLLRNQKGHTAMHLAGVAGLFEIVELLKSKGAQQPPPKNLSAELATASATNGEALFMTKCVRCHGLPREKISAEGPSLWDVVGRQQASFEGFDYSAAFQRLDDVWSFENLNSLLADSRNYVPGNAMSQGDATMISKPQDRADIISFLRLQSDAPVALP